MSVNGSLPLKGSCNFRILVFLRIKEDNLCWNSRPSERSLKDYINEGVHAYFLLMEIDVGQTKLFGKKSLCPNLNPIKPSQTFFKQWNGWSWKWFGALFLTFLISLVPYCLTVYVYLAFLGITKMWVSIRLLHWKRDLLSATYT